jgi:MFS family permease
VASQPALVGITALTTIVLGMGHGPAFVAGLMADLNASASAVAFTLMLDAFGVILGCLAGGRLGDQRGRRVTLLASLGIFGVATLLCSFAVDVTLFGAIRFIAGLAFGAAIPLAVTLSSEYVSTRHQPLAVAVTMSGLTLGGMLTGFAAAFVLQTFKPRVLFVGDGLATVVLAGVLVKVLPESQAFVRRSEQFSWRTMLSPVVRRQTLALACAFFFCGLAISSQALWPTLANSVAVETTTLTALRVAPAASILVALIGAGLAVRSGTRLVALWMAGLAALTAFSASAAMIAGVFVPLIIGGALTAAVYVLLYSLASRAYETSIRASGVGAASALGYAAQLVGPLMASSLVPKGPIWTVLMHAGAISAVFLTILLMRDQARE